jgi:hypothetical protein
LVSNGKCMVIPMKICVLNASVPRFRPQSRSSRSRTLCP